MVAPNTVNGPHSPSIVAFIFVISTLFCAPVYGDINKAALLYLESHYDANMPGYRNAHTSMRRLMPGDVVSLKNQAPYADKSTCFPSIDSPTTAPLDGWPDIHRDPINISAFDSGEVTLEHDRMELLAIGYRPRNPDCDALFDKSTIDKYELEVVEAVIVAKRTICIHRTKGDGRLGKFFRGIEVLQKPFSKALEPITDFSGTLVRALAGMLMKNERQEDKYVEAYSTPDVPATTSDDACAGATYFSELESGTVAFSSFPASVDDWDYIDEQ